MTTFRREGYIIAIEGGRTREGAPLIKIKFGDLQDGRVVPFVLSNGVKINPSPALVLIRGLKGDTEMNQKINKEQLDRLGYEGDHKTAPTVGQFKCGATRINPTPAEIMWEVTEYGNEVKSIRDPLKESGIAFFTGEPAKDEEPEPWDQTDKNNQSQSST